MLLQKKENYLDFIMKRGGKSRAVRKPADVPTSLLDAYTESQPTSTMSDSDKFKEGYVKKKDKGKQKRTSKKSETEEDHEQEVKEEEVDTKESWEEEVIESWENLEVGEMPVPQKVKQVMRKEEKKRKKEEKKAAEKEKSEEAPVITEVADTVTEDIKDLSLKDKVEEDQGSKDKAAAEPAAEGEKTKAQLKAERKALFEQQQKLKAAGQPAEEKQGEKSKAELKAERRAKQEAQRKAKTEAQEKKTSEQKPPPEEKKVEKKTEKKIEKAAVSRAEPGRHTRQVGLFSHLHQYERDTVQDKKMAVVGGDVHPAVLQVGLQHADCQVVGSSGRCVSLLLALKSLLVDSLPLLSSSSELYKDVDSLINTNTNFLRQVGGDRQYSWSY